MGASRFTSHTSFSDSASKTRGRYPPPTVLLSPQQLVKEELHPDLRWHTGQSDRCFVAIGVSEPGRIHRDRIGRITPSEGCAAEALKIFRLGQREVGALAPSH